MSYTFDPKEMAEDLLALSKVAGDFLRPNSVGRLERLKSSLLNAVASAKNGGNNDFSWKTEEGSPIEIAPSRWWKGNSADLDPMMAKISVDYCCIYLPADERVCATGAVVMAIGGADGGREKIVHFDADKGGWIEQTPDGPRESAGHPPLHVQFHGVVNDIPRIPSMIVHPVDVISLSILELHQKKWRQYTTGAKGRSELRLIPKRQRHRLNLIIGKWTGMMSQDGLALISMQRPFPQPLAL